MLKFVFLLVFPVSGFNIDTDHAIILSASGEGFGHSLELVSSQVRRKDFFFILFHRFPRLGIVSYMLELL